MWVYESRLNPLNQCWEVIDMDRWTYERAIHLWPEWHESIEESRSKLGYDPKWPIDRAVNWIEENYSPAVRSAGKSEILRLNLPENLLPYWEDCFYCDYRRLDGTSDLSKITRRIGIEVFDRSGNGTGNWQRNKVLPDLPYVVSLVYPDDDEIDSQRLRIQIQVMAHLPLVTHELLEAAFELAWRGVRAQQRLAYHSISPGKWPHPLSEFIASARANRSEEKRIAIERYNRGEIDFEGIIREQWASLDNQQMIAEILDEFNSSHELHIELDKRRKRVYDRVRKWFPDPRPKLKIRGTLKALTPISDSGVVEK